jgi:hypothetical protein
MPDPAVTLRFTDTMIPRVSRRVPAPGVAVLAFLLLAAACARAPVHAPVVETGRVPERASGSVPFSFATDTFAFANEIRSRHPGQPGLYANYCFVLARGLRQFAASARFEPSAPRLDHAGYVERVRAVATRSPWLDPLPADERVVIPGYANLREFSAAEESAVKEGLGPRFWTLVHWTNWRITMPVTRGHQATVAQEIVDDLRHRHLSQLLVTNWPKPELNHTVVAFAYRDGPGGVDLSVWDPNDPSEPGVITFDRADRRFRATRLFDTEPGVIRVFRMSYSWLL